MTDLFFPSEDHRRSLVDKVKAGGISGLDDLELRQFHGYRYAWRRVRLGDFTQKYGADPQGDWFDGYFVNKAVELYTGGKYLRPPAAEQRQPPSAEDIAHIEEGCRRLRNNADAFDERNRAAFAQEPPSGVPADDAAALAQAQRELGITVTETTGETRDRNPEPPTVRETETVPA